MTNYEARTKVLKELANELDPLIAMLTEIKSYDCIKAESPRLKQYLSGDAGDPQDAFRFMVHLDSHCKEMRELSCWGDIWNRTAWAGFGSLGILAMMNARQPEAEGTEAFRWGKFDPKFNELMSELLDAIGMLRRGSLDPQKWHFNVNMNEGAHPTQLPMVLRLTDEVKEDSRSRMASIKKRLSSS